MELNTKDKKILSLLLNDCRLTNSQIAKKINSSREVVAYRIKQLEEEGIINGYSVDINFEKLGYVFYSIDMFLNDSSSEKIESLKKRSKIVYLQKSLGKYNLSCNILVKDFSEFKKEYDYIIRLLGKNIIDINSNMLLSDINFSEEFFIKKKGAEHKFLDDVKKISIDSIDEKILTELGLNARQSLVDISGKVGASVPTVSNKIKRLKKENAIRNTVSIDYKKIGYHRYSLMIFANPEKENEIVKFCNQYSQVWYIGKLSGNYNYVLEILARDNSELDLFVNLMREKLRKDILKYDILIATILYKQGRFYI